MQTKLLSIIIPTYNMEPYLRHCLDSLIIDKGMDELEVFVINDGSKDRSSKIAREYQDKYPNTFYVIDKVNGNYGSCINRGLKEATGKYIKVLDADDCFNARALQDVIQRLMNIDTDVILTNYVIVRNEKTESFFLNYADGQVVNIDSDVVEYFSMHNVIYKRSLLKNMDYIQTEGISYTDQEWIFYPMLKADSAVFFNLSLYRYTLGREGQTMDWGTLCRNIGMIENIVMQMLIRLTDYKNDISVCRRKYVENVLQVQIELIYRVELLSKRKELCNIEILNKIDKMISIKNLVKKLCIWYLMLNTFEKELFFLIDFVICYYYYKN